MYDHHTLHPHPIEGVAYTTAPSDWYSNQAEDEHWTFTPPPPPPTQQAHALAKVDIYLDDFILNCKGGPK